MQTIPITIQNKIASVPCGTFIVADNPTEYQLLFTFDSEWSGYTVKTARFLIGGYYTDVDFTGNTVTIPSMPSNVSKISVGVYADLLATTTPAKISVMPSVLATAENATQYDPAEPSVLPDVDELALDDTFVVTDVSEGEKARATIGQVVDYVQSASQIEPADTNPIVDGTASAGSSDAYARGDHVHPTDTSRVAVTDYEQLEYTVGVMAEEVQALDYAVGQNNRDIETLNKYTVRADVAQNFTAAQQAQARSSIGAASLSDIGTVFTIKGEVTSVSDLPASGNAVGDVYYVSSVQAGYIWLETTDHPNGYWEELGEPIDLSAYAQLASPAFTGTPTAPTASSSTNNTQIATTAFVKSVLPSVPSASSATPAALGTAAAGSSSDFSRADHVHAMPSASDVGALPSNTTYVSTVNGQSGAVTVSVPSDYVAYSSQSLTDAQKTQARTNIGAGTYTKPSGGIPASDLASGVIPEKLLVIYTLSGIDNGATVACDKTYNEIAVALQLKKAIDAYAVYGNTVVGRFTSMTFDGTTIGFSLAYADGSSTLPNNITCMSVWHYSSGIMPLMVNRIIAGTNITPAANGIASPGYEKYFYALADHVHPMPTASDIGAIAAPSSPATGAFLVWDGSAWTAQTLATWQGGNY